ncbi:MAG: hypothetical protein QG646_250 [Euryarchaeota archaeon]|nr:hypothetical protein [Euryarchaeota archaeon]
MGLSPINNWLENMLIYILFTCSIFSISFIFSILFNKLFRKKSFEQIGSELHFKKTPSEEILVIKYIHSYLQKNTFEEILFLNLKCNGIQYFPYYHSFFLALLFVISVMVSYFYYLSGLKGLSVILSLTMAIILPTFIFGVISRKAGIEKASLEKIWIRILENIVETNLKIIFSFYFFAILFIGMVELLFTNQEEVFSSTLNNYLNYPINFFKYLYYFNINNPIQGPQLSLAGFYFTLAVSGTVVLSIIDRYFKEEELLKDKLVKQVNIFKNLYNKPDFSLSLNLSDVISFNYKNMSLIGFNIKKIIHLNNENIKKFADNLSKIRTELECEEIDNKRKPVNRYKFFILFIIATYILGIVTIFIPNDYSTFILWVFIGDSLLFSVLIFFIYRDFEARKFG